MKPSVLLDAEPLVALLAASVDYHEWACEQWRRLPPPLLTCEAVLTEAAFLLKRNGREADPLFARLERGVVRVGLEIERERADLRVLMRRYRDRPLSLADACLVRLSELHPGGTVFTLDAGLGIYRRHGNKVIPVLSPNACAEDRPGGAPSGKRWDNQN